MSEKTIRSHRTRVKQANETLKNHPRYKHERINIFDREAFVEFYLLEDIVKLYTMRLENEMKYVAQGRAGQKGNLSNIKKFTSVINIINAAMEVARASIDSADYSKVWSAIPEHALMYAANSVKHLPALRKLAIKMLRDLSDDESMAEEMSQGINEDLDDLESHEKNVRAVKGISEPETQETIEDIIRAAEETVNAGKRAKNILDSN